MMTDQIRKQHNEQPFTPFRFHLADGRTIGIPHPDFLYVPPKNERTVYVTDDHGLVEAIDVLMIVSMKPIRRDRDGGKPERGDDAPPNGNGRRRKPR